MKIIHLNGFSADEFIPFKPVVYSNTVQAMAAIINAMTTLKNSFDDQTTRLQLEHDARRVLETYQTARETEPFGAELLASMKRLWADPSFRQCFARSSEYQLSDSAHYFFDNLDRIGSPAYLPNEQDVLRTRVTTTGVVEVKFTFKTLNFLMVDVGGQRSERRKWIHCFEAITAVIYFIGISEYDQMMLEDEHTNRMHDSLQLFETIVNSKWFVESAFILFFNKKDLFEEKIKHRPLSICFPKYSGPNEYEPATSYIQAKFLETNKSTTKELYCHFTCATDTKNVLFVFDAVSDTIMTGNLKHFGVI
jgi:hypothetical protein